MAALPLLDVPTSTTTRTTALQAAIAMAAALSGTAVVLVTAPVGLWPLHYVLFVPVLIHQILGQHRRWTAWAFPVVMLAAYGWWLVPSLVTYTEIGWLPATALVTLLVLVTAAPLSLVFATPAWLRTRLGRRWPLAWAALFVGMELAVDQLALFPTTLAGAQLPLAPVRQWVALGGTGTVTFIVALTNALLVEAALRRREGRRTSAATQPLAALWLIVLSIGTLRSAQLAHPIEAAPVHRVGIIQTDYDAKRKERDPMGMVRHFNAETDTLGKQDTDLILWPEGGMLGTPGHPTAPLAPAKQLVRTSRRHGVDLVVGSSSRRRAMGTQLEQDETFRTWNSASLFTGGAYTQVHDKVLRMPFAEYLPLADVLPSWLRDVGLRYTGNMQPGRSVSLLDGSLRYGVAICYEAFHARHVARLNDADLLLVLANDSWYGDTAAPHLSASFSQLRALETGRTVVRSGLTGVSLVATPDGALREHLAPFETATELWDVPVAKVWSPYRTLGDAFSVLCLVGGLLLIGQGARRSRP